MSEKKQATEKKDVKATAAAAKEARTEKKDAQAQATEAPKKEAKKEPTPVVPQTKDVGVYKLTEKATAEFEKMKGQRKLMVAAFIKAGKPVAATDLHQYFEDLSALTKQNPQAVIDYHCLKMTDEGYLIETGKVTVEVPKRQRKAKEEASTGTASAEASAPTTAQ